MPSPFVLNARYGLFTYSQCDDLDPHHVSDHFSSMGAECIVARENHADGGLHLHVFADFGRKFRSRNTRAFDVDGRHPNIVPSQGTPELGWDYATKYGDILAGGLERPAPADTADGRSDGKWAQIVAAGSRDEFWELLQALAPRDMVTSFGACRAFADYRFAETHAEYATPDGIGFINGDLDGRNDWVQQSGIGSGELVLGEFSFFFDRAQSVPVPSEPPEGARSSGIWAGAGIQRKLTLTVGRRMSLCLFGASRTGKTLWARSLGNHIYNIGLVSGTECLKGPTVDYAVFDDIRGGIGFFPSFKEWLGCQLVVTVKCLYKEPQPVHWGKPAIWLSNTDPRLDMKSADVEWMEANCVFIQVNEPIFRANTPSPQ